MSSYVVRRYRRIVVERRYEPNADACERALQLRNMSLEASKALVRRYLEEVTKGNLDIMDELLARDFVDRNPPPGHGPTHEDHKRSVEEILGAFSITSFIIEEQIAEGDTVLTKYRQSGIARGELFDVPQSEQEETLEGIFIHRVSGGKITEAWHTINIVPMWEDLAQEVRERIEQELQVARSIQQASLPKQVLKLEGWQITPYYQPRRWEETSTTSSSYLTNA